MDPSSSLNWTYIHDTTKIMMKEVDIPMASFHTHEGHSDFLVMPFYICNDPSTFQILVNKIFRYFLHNFVLILFVDILIYNTTWECHLEHVDSASWLLRDY